MSANVRVEPTLSTVKMLFALSGNVCSYTGCEEKLTDPAWRSVKARIAHIYGERPGAARHDPSMTDDERRHFDNLILLCPNCHVRIDDLEPDAHPPERLLEMKEKALRAAQRRDAWAHDVLLERFAEQAVRILRQSAELGQSGEFHLELGDRPIASFRGQSEVPREDERSDVGRLLTEAGDLLVTEDGDPLALEHESNPQPVKKTDSTPSEWAITSTDAQPIQTFTPESSAGHGPASARLASDEGARRVGDLDEDDYDGNDVNLTSTAQPRTASQTDRHPT